jgi:hypothetical protein
MLLSALLSGKGNAQIATQFSHSVRAGIASVSVPIAVPPGTAGLAPTLSFEYSGSGGGSFMGQGWSISGFGSITRCPMINATDKRVQAPLTDDAEAFCLNGQRLIQIEGSAGVPPLGAAQVQFRTELESFARIVAYRVPYPLGTFSNPFVTGGVSERKPWEKVLGWRVWTKSGLVMEYGAPNQTSWTQPPSNTALQTQVYPLLPQSVGGGSVTGTVNSEFAMSWSLHRTIDSSKNVIEYSYLQPVQTAWQTSGQFYDVPKPDKILYGGNLVVAAGGALAHHSEVGFVWENTPAPAMIGIGYGGQYTRSAQRLKSVTTKTKSFGLDTWINAKIYNVNYSQAVGAGSESTLGYRPLVGSIDECLGNCATDLVFPVSFSYGQSNSSLPKFDPSLKHSFEAPGLVGNEPPTYTDVNGDGITDACWFYWVQIPVIRCAVGKKDFITGNFVGFSNVLIESPVGWDVVWPDSAGLVSATPRPALLGFFEVNGDGYVDACFTGLGNVSNLSETVTRHHIPVRCLRGDGEGRFTSVGGVLNPTGLSFINPPVGSAISSWTGKSDLNGDGIADFCLTGADSGFQRLACFISDPMGGPVIPVSLNDPKIIYQGVSAGLSFVDFNRDGLVDFCFADLTVDGVYCSLLRDRGEGFLFGPRYKFDEPVKIVTGPGQLGLIRLAWLGDNEKQASWADVNGDGKLDFCYHLKNVVTGQRSNLACHLGDGQTLSYDPRRFAIWDTLAAAAPGRQFIDINNDGKTDFCYFLGVTGNFQFVCNLFGAQALSATNSTGIGPLPEMVALRFNEASAGGPNLTAPVDGTPAGAPSSQVLVNVGSRNVLSLCRNMTPANAAVGVICTGIPPEPITYALDSVAGGGNGKSVSFEYQWLTNYAGFTTAKNISKTADAPRSNVPTQRQNTTSGFSYPYIATVPPHYAVVKTREKVGALSVGKDTDYKYENYVVDVATGRGSLGFEATEELPLVNNAGGRARSRSVVELMWPLSGQLREALTWAPNGQLLKHVVPTYAFNQATYQPIIRRADNVLNGVGDSTCGGFERSPSWVGPWPLIMRAISSDEKTWVPGASGSIFQSWVRTSTLKTDVCGNVEVMQVIYLNAAGASTEYETLTTNEYLSQTPVDGDGWVQKATTANSRWYLGRLSKSTVKSKAPDFKASDVTSALMPVAGVSLDPLPLPVAGVLGGVPWLPAVLYQLNGL